MFYKLLNELFGWDYIQWDNGFGSGIARVHKGKDDVPWFWQYKCTKCAKRIHYAESVIWLTCHPDKYMKTEEQRLEELKEWLETV